MNKTELKLYLGLKIKEYRNKLGLSQEELAERIGRNQRQISLIEIGKSFPNPETIIALTDVFDC
ncbi:MAG: helix-turn-helix transcriptional regulator [bacterium]|nr:helix-turn-helix transcriptional regulator [bacterium]